MANFILSPQMSLPVPVVGIDSGPDYAFNINSSLSLIDVMITPMDMVFKSIQVDSISMLISLLTVIMLQLFAL